MRSLIQRLRTRLPTSGEPTDEHLLDDFLTRRAEDAFAAIVHRHGPMVRGVCRRVLRNDTDADDAFQAVFVVLLRKAEAVRPRSQLGNWLYGVAVNVARRGRDAVARRRTRELTTDVPGRESEGELDRNELKAVIDQELSGLPVAYRAAVVACDLEGHTRAEAAGRLGWSEGTVASRLARGRALLADRLTRRGLAIPAAGLVAVLGTNTADAIPAISFHLLVTSPPTAVEALAMEAMRAMTTSKLKTIAVVLLATVGLTGVGAATVWACGGYGPRPAPPVSEAKPYPFASIETTEAKADEPATGARPVPKDNTVAAGTDRPTGTGDAGVAKPAQFVMANPARDITIVSDRHEEFVEFFRRQPVLIAVVAADVREKMLYSAKGPVDFNFLEKASFNVDGPRAAVYGASVKIAPVAFDGPVSRLLETTSATQPVVFVRDASDKNLWHAVGYTRRSSVGFFTGTERVAPDTFAPADLLHLEKPQKKGTVPPKSPEVKPTRLANPAKDIFAISDRDETIPQFFARQRVIAGSVDAKTLALLAQGKGTPDKVFVDGVSTNDGDVLFGAFVRIEAPNPAVTELITGYAKAATGERKQHLTVLFVPDAKLADVYHPTGYTLHGGSQFYDVNKKSPGDDFSPHDLLRGRKK